MKLEFGKYTEVTKLAKKLNSPLFGCYEKVYICPDTLNWWLAGIQKDINEDYEECPGTYLVERDKIDYPNYDRIQDAYLNEETVSKVLEEWACETWDSEETSSLEEAIEIVDGGYGIIPEED